MSILRTALAAANIAKAVVRSPAVRAGVALAPVLLSPAVRAKAREAALSTAYDAGRMARAVVDKARSTGRPDRS
ncbi:hypothetical protein [Devosia sp.]|uniref:hypothetical protein n=1 Tax=Devosia sp. TaxID=1871048 RepID=UPI0035B39530